jgi:hypothetical protein
MAQTITHSALAVPTASIEIEEIDENESRELWTLESIDRDRCTGMNGTWQISHFQTWT